MNRVVFMGTPHYAKRILQELLDADDVEVVHIFTQPDKPVGRGGRITPSAVKQLALKEGIALSQPSHLKDNAAIDTLRAVRFDYIVVAAYGQLLPKQIQYRKRRLL